MKEAACYLQGEHVLSEVVANFVNCFDHPALLLGTVQHQLQRESVRVEVGAVPEEDSDVDLNLIMGGPSIHALCQKTCGQRYEGVLPIQHGVQLTHPPRQLLLLHLVVAGLHRLGSVVQRFDEHLLCEEPEQDFGWLSKGSRD